MALRNLTPEQSRQLALALLVGVVIAGLALVAIPTWLLNKRYDTVLSDLNDKLSRFQRIAATRPEVVKNLESVRGKDARKFFLRSGGAALSAAEAQEALRGLVETNGGRMITMQAPTAREEGRYRQVTANVQITANILALRRIIHAIETNPPFLFVENLMVRAQVPSNFRPGPGQEPEMFVQFDVAGYALTGS